MTHWEVPFGGQVVRVQPMRFAADGAAGGQSLFRHFPFRCEGQRRPPGALNGGELEPGSWQWGVGSGKRLAVSSQCSASVM